MYSNHLLFFTNAYDIAWALDEMVMIGHHGRLGTTGAQHGITATKVLFLPLICITLFTLSFITLVFWWLGI